MNLTMLGDKAAVSTRGDFLILFTLGNVTGHVIMSWICKAFSSGDGTSATG